MKTFRWCLPFFVAFCCFSCKQSEESFTPYVQVSYFYLNPQYKGDQIVSAKDTLMLHWTDGVYVMDTIGLNDTVAFQVLFGSYANELTATRVTHDSAQLDMWPILSLDVRNILKSSSDLRRIQLEVNPGYNVLSFPVLYKPKASGTYQFSLVCESDSKLSPSTVLIKQPVR